MKWLNDSEVLVWPISFPNENPSTVGRLGPVGGDILGIGYPLNIVTDRSSLACVLPEDQIIAGATLDRQCDLIAVFSLPGLQRVARFIEPFMQSYNSTRFMEAEHVVLDGSAHRIWFVAYDTPYLWCFFYNSLMVATCSLGCPRESVVAITCYEDRVAVAVRQFGGVYLRLYRESAGQFEFEHETALTFADDVESWIVQALQANSGDFIGYAGGTIAFGSENRVILLDVHLAICPNTNGKHGL